MVHDRTSICQPAASPRTPSPYNPSVDDAVAMLVTLGPGALMAKADLKSAFHMIPVHRADWELLGMFWQGHYYVDTRLPFSLRSAPYLFNKYADALLDPAAQLPPLSHHPLSG